MESDLRKRLNQFKSLLRVCKAMTSEHSVSRLLELIAREAASIMGAERSSIFLVTPDSEHLETEVALGVDSEGIRISKMSGIAGHVFKTGEVVNVEDAYKDRRFLSDVDRRTGFITRSILAVPLAAPDGNRIGVFQVLNKHGGKFDIDDIELLEAFAGQAAVAIINAREFEFLKRSEASLIKEKTDLIGRLKKRFSADTFLGVSEKIVSLREFAVKVAQSSASVLIYGESGTGKDLLAKIIHYESPRSGGPFVAINCAALPETLLESELFGIEEGVATGVSKREGKIESANGGTLFLDEIGDMSLPMQAKLLRVLQEREVERVGGRKAIPVDIRIIAATNKNLEDLISKGKFRSDLFYRINVIPVQIPPLRERVEDIPVLAEHFVSLAKKRYGKEIDRISVEAMERLCAFKWEGNVRELENEIERATALASSREISVEDLSDKVQTASTVAKPGTMESAIETLERKMILEALKETGGNKSLAAQKLGLSREGLRKKLARYKLQDNE